MFWLDEAKFQHFDLHVKNVACGNKLTLHITQHEIWW